MEVVLIIFMVALVTILFLEMALKVTIIMAPQIGNMVVLVDLEAAALESWALQEVPVDIQVAVLPVLGPATRITEAAAAPTMQAPTRPTS